MVRNRLRTLTPSSDEKKQKWWRMSLEYFHNVSKAKVHREVDVRTNVHHDVDEGLSVLDVHHDVEEGLSVPELLKKISDMQRDFQSRITAVEQFVNHHKRCYLLFFLVLTWEADLDLKRSVTIIQKEKDRTKEGGDDGPRMGF
ncbi:hypothetical protein Tco_1552848 [Tanacetum coccineum]